MLQFVQPIWLAAMAGVAIPLVIHLWNDRPGKVLRIGSITLLEQGSVRRSWSRRLSEWWLLLLRCLLLIVLAFLLAGPQWRQGPGVSKKGWLLVDGTALPAPYGGIADSLLKAGYERQVLDSSGNYWESFRQLDERATAGMPFFVISSGRAVRFAGPRPVTSRPVQWVTYAQADSVDRWVAGAWRSGVDSARVLTVSSGPTGTTCAYEMVGAPPGTMTVRGVPVDTTALYVNIQADVPADGRWVEAAVKALAAITHRDIRVNATGKADWLFWLSVKPLPADHTAKNVFCYAPGREMRVDTWMEGGADIGIGKEVRLPAAYAAVWRDGYGRALLGQEGNVYYFGSRLDPAWNGLVWNRSFPLLLEGLLFQKTIPEQSVRDRRVLDPEQIVPVKRKGVETPGPSTAAVDLGPAFWSLLFLLFVFERFVANGLVKR